MGQAKSTLVLCEDEAHWLFVYRWLTQRGVHPGELRLVPLPSGRRAGTQHVLARVATEVGEYRRRANHVSGRKLVVVIDADTATVATRLTALNSALVAEGQEARAPGERICFLVPRRNLETWIHFFAGHEADESTDYKALYRDDIANSCFEAARAFEEWLKDGAATSTLSSLRAARLEVERIS